MSSEAKNVTSVNVQEIELIVDVMNTTKLRFECRRHTSLLLFMIKAPMPTR